MSRLTEISRKAEKNLLTEFGQKNQNESRLVGIGQRAKRIIGWPKNQNTETRVS